VTTAEAGEVSFLRSRKMVVLMIAVPLFHLFGMDGACRMVYAVQDALLEILQAHSL
jgi:hypothetical protein